MSVFVWVITKFRSIGMPLTLACPVWDTGNQLKFAVDTGEKLALIEVKFESPPRENILRYDLGWVVSANTSLSHRLRISNVKCV